MGCRAPFEQSICFISAQTSQDILEKTLQQLNGRLYGNHPALTGASNVFKVARPASLRISSAAQASPQGVFTSFARELSCQWFFTVDTPAIKPLTGDAEHSRPAENRIPCIVPAAIEQLPCHAKVRSHRKLRDPQQGRLPNHLSFDIPPKWHRGQRECSLSRRQRWLSLCSPASSRTRQPPLWLPLINPREYIRNHEYEPCKWQSSPPT